VDRCQTQHQEKLRCGGKLWESAALWQIEPFVALWQVVVSTSIRWCLLHLPQIDKLFDGTKGFSYLLPRPRTTQKAVKMYENM